LAVVRLEPRAQSRPRFAFRFLRDGSSASDSACAVMGQAGMRAPIYYLFAPLGLALSI
jgi:hypothetical protein